MEMAAHVSPCDREIKPDCVAVEFAETMQLQLLHAASRLPDISIVITYNQRQSPFITCANRAMRAFEANPLRAKKLRFPRIASIWTSISIPMCMKSVPDPYAIQRIGLQELL